MSALSDSTTTMLSPLDTCSPSVLSQETILPSVMVEERAGMKISRTLAHTCARRGWLPTEALPRRACRERAVGARSRWLLV